MKVAINGFGRIGRLAFKLLMEESSVEVVAINDLTDKPTLAHLLKYDTVHGRYPGEVSADDSHLTVNGKTIHATAIADPEQLPWGDLGVDIVVECTGRFRTKELAEKHLTAGAKKVLISAPAKGDIPTIVLGVNSEKLTATDTIISNASCTTNCLAPMIQLLEKNFGLDKAYVTTVHAYTADQNIHDAPHRDLRRARAAAQNIVPTTTNAAKALKTVMDGVDGKVFASAIRVPVIDGSLTEVTALVKKEVTVEEVNAAFKTAAEGAYKGIVEYCTEELVSSDIIGNTHSSIFDAGLTQAHGNFVRITSWYDNEFGYANRLKDLVLRIQQLS